jgi:two-component system LytT family sensor kinase
MESPLKVKRYNEIIPVMVWTFIFVLPFALRIILFRNDPRNGSLLDIFFSFLTIIGVFYIHTYLVYPVLQKKNGKLFYSLLLVTCFAGFLVSMRFFMHGLPGFTLIFPFTLVIFCSYCYRLYINKIRQAELIKELQTNHLKTELDFLRSQISPHFMFNLMNTLVSMARKKSALMEPSLISLSQLMRYMLYDSNSGKISLVQELDYLKSYINLQLLRFGDTLQLNLFVSGDTAGYQIEPMLLIPFVENAFKHGTSASRPVIDIDIAMDNLTGRLRLTVINATAKTSPGTGIGLTNVRRRLELLYPGKFELETGGTGGRFMVNLILSL